jgi:L-ascorbate metabolism protein UlaG (beta-lactamase superfamily)
MITDPVWSKRVGPFFWVGSKRVRAPGLTFDQLPKIDLILLSHDHYDHLDRPTIQAIMKRDAPQLYCGLGVSRTLVHNGIKGAKEMDWWQETSYNADVKVTFTPCQHFSGRGFFDQDATLWGSFVISAPCGHIYFAGDSGYSHHFKMVRQRIGKMAFSILPIGTYEPRWFMKPYHMSPEDAVKAHVDLESEQSIGIHYGTFHLSDEGYEQPVLDLKKCLENSDLKNKSFQALGFGEFISCN